MKMDKPGAFARNEADACPREALDGIETVLETIPPGAELPADALLAVLRPIFAAAKDCLDCGDCGGSNDND